MYGANSKEMAVRDKFTYFAFAGLGADGKLRLQKLPEGTVAREVFTAGGWTPPSIDNLVNRIEALSDLDFKERLDEAVAIVKLCCEGYGLDCHLLTYVKAGTANKLDAISTIFLGLAGWPQLSDVALAIQVFLETYEQEWKNRQKHSAAEKQAAFNKTVSEMQASGRDISPLSVAAWMMGFKDLGDKIPHEAKERARKLKKEFRNSFGGETSVEID